MGEKVAHHVYSKDEHDELKRARPATFEEFEALVEQVWQHAEAQQHRDRWASEPGRTIRDTAATQAVRKLIRRMRRRWQAGDGVVPWDATWQTYRAAFTSELIDIRRTEARLTKRIVPLSEIGYGEDPASDDPDPLAARATWWPTSPPRWDRVDEWDLEGVDPYQPEGVRLQRAAPTLLAAVAIRMLRVLADRQHRPQLSDQEAMISRFFQERELSMLALTDGDLVRASRFAEPGEWRRGLADSLEIPVTRVYKATEKILDFVRLGWYLFIVLAPRDDAVVEIDEMSRLLDLTHQPTRAGLEATECMLLRKAGATLTGTPRVQVDVGAFVRRSQTDLRRVASLPGTAIVELLHRAELGYASHVRGQVDPPAFQCVLACEHHPSEPEGTHDRR